MIHGITQSAYRVPIAHQVYSAMMPYASVITFTAPTALPTPEEGEYGDYTNAGRTLSMSGEFIDLSVTIDGADITADFTDEDFTG